MTDTISLNINLTTIFVFALVALFVVVISVIIFFFPRALGELITKFLSDDVKNIYKRLIYPYQNWLGLVTLLTVADSFFLLISISFWLRLIEISIGLATVIMTTWLGYKIFSELFDVYLLETVVIGSSKINSEFLIVGKYLANITITVATIFIFAQVHDINVLGLLASLGIGGLAVAFAAQKTLEQVLGGIVIYLDKPFVSDDYIGLPDGTFGRVESVGLRSTKIRTSGKGTLMIVPNSSLTQINIENFTGAKKVVSLIYLNFYQIIAEDEKALIRQIILDSTSDIFGIDSRSTEVIFKTVQGDNGKSVKTQAQINFFILGSGQVSMELRRQFLDIAKQNIAQQLREYGTAFDIEEKTINVDSPITV